MLFAQKNESLTGLEQHERERTMRDFTNNDKETASNTSN